MIDIELRDGVVRQPVLGRVGAELPVAVMGQAVRSADPQAPVGAGRQGGVDRVRRQVAVGLVEDHEIVAVEARQSFVGAQPQVAVGGLRDGADGVLGQTSPNVFLPITGSITYC